MINSGQQCGTDKKYGSQHAELGGKKQRYM